MPLYAELKRRKVFRVAIACLAAAWLVTEAAGTLWPGFGVAEWGLRFIVIVPASGFVPARVISRARVLAPRGLKRDQDVLREASVTRLPACTALTSEPPPMRRPAVRPGYPGMNRCTALEQPTSW